MKLSTAYSLYLTAFHGVGVPDRTIPAPFESALVTGFRDPGVSQILLPPNGVLTSTQTDRLMGWFRTHRDHSKYSTPHPYFAYLDRPESSERRDVVRSLRGFDWRELTPVKHVKIWNEPIPLHLPKGFQLRIGSLKERSESEIYQALAEQNFGMPRALSSKVIETIRKLPGETGFYSIHTRAGRAIACGTTVMHRGAVLLGNGNVLKEYRRRGIWSALLAARQAVTFAQGAVSWILVTSSPELEKVGAFHFRKREISISGLCDSRSA